jgi:hypothetical protein
MNVQVLKDLKVIGERNEGKFNMLPRFYNSTLGAVIATGIFSTKRDGVLNKLLHNWMQRSTEANIRFSATELHTMSHPGTAANFLKTLRNGGVMQKVEASLIGLSNHVTEKYSRESGITNETVFFFTPESPEPS